MSGHQIAQPVELTDVLGVRSRVMLTPAQHVALFVRAVHLHDARLREATGARPDAALIEACAVARGKDGRARPRRGIGASRFLRAGDIDALSALSATTRAAGQECWCSVLGRDSASPGGAAVGGGALLWADVDDPATLWRARALRARLAVRLVVESAGASDPRQPRWHLYLALSRRLPGDELEAANAALAEQLGGDRVGDRGRLMRVPGSVNRKSGAPGRMCRVVACDLHSPPHDLEEIVPLDRVQTRARARVRARAPLAAGGELAPRGWFALLEPGAAISDDGYARCPLHDDHVPSLKLYERAEQGWYCWACTRGGDALEFLSWRRHGRPARELDSANFRRLTRELTALTATIAATHDRGTPVALAASGAAGGP